MASILLATPTQNLAPQNFAQPSLNCCTSFPRINRPERRPRSIAANSCRDNSSGSDVKSKSWRGTPVVRTMFLVIFECVRQPGTERHLRRRTLASLNLVEVAVVIADMDRLTVGREWDELVLSSVVQRNGQCCTFLQTVMLVVRQVEDLAFR